MKLHVHRFIHSKPADWDPPPYALRECCAQQKINAVPTQKSALITMYNQRTLCVPESYMSAVASKSLCHTLFHIASPRGNALGPTREIYKRPICEMENSVEVDETGAAATSTGHTLLTSNSPGPVHVNITVSPILSSFASQNRAQPWVKEQNVCFPNVFVAVFTGHGAIGPCRVYHAPSNPPTPLARQNAVGTSCAHPKHLKNKNRRMCMLAIAKPNTIFRLQLP